MRRGGEGQPLIQADAAAGNQARPNQWVEVTPVQQLVGRELRSKDGKPAGRIDSVVLDLEHGVAVFAVAGSQGGAYIGNDTDPLPFTALNLTSWGDHDPVTVGLTLDQIDHGTRVPQNQLGELANPDRIRQIYGSFGVPVPEAYGGPPNPNQEKQPYGFALAQPDKLMLMGGGDPSPLRDVLATWVVRQNGDRVGKVGRVMIDTATSRIAYVLLTAGGVFGIAPAWLAVPPEAITWSAKKNSFVLNDNETQPETTHVLDKSSAPAKVRRADLTALYSRFKVTPYWDASRPPNQG
jgi:sporulation protein YlmC with PRC-barrel domain